MVALHELSTNNKIIIIGFPDIITGMSPHFSYLRRKIVSYSQCIAQNMSTEIFW